MANGASESRPLTAARAISAARLSRALASILLHNARMTFTRHEILAMVLVAAGSLGAASSCSSSSCAPIPCPAPGFDPNTCECSKPQTGEAGNSAGGTAGDGANAGAGGSSGDAGAGATANSGST